MTSAAERIKEQHRGWRRAEPASMSRLAALKTFGLRYVRVDDFNVVVEGEYELNLAMSFWRSRDGTAQGYLVSTLDAEIKKQTIERLATDVPPGTTLLMIDPFNSISEKPVTGRDNVQVELETADRHVESATGSHLLLPMVNPWP